MALFHCVVRLGMARFVFPLQFSTALEWAGLYTSPHQALAGLYCVTRAISTISNLSMSCCAHYS